ncbi:hypothetical protein J4209_02215 [Candidatus Woesearchaeota archaeon]|nr:hypothetical protein [Candidatus Woesearchaeota archaeon]
MDHDGEGWKKELEKVKPVKRCPKCHGLALTFDIENGKICCEDCGYEETTSKI